MNVNDWFEVPMPDHIHMFSANGVHYPLDEWLKKQGQMTTEELARKLRNDI